MSQVVVEEAFEKRVGASRAPIFLTCEHASQRLPEPYRFPEADQHLIGTHWAYDLGARELTLELADALDASAVLSRFSRLLIDPNREEDHPDLLRSVAEGKPVALNQHVTAQERERRVKAYYRPFHEAIDAELSAVAAPVLLSVHSFTPVYEGQVRKVELGVLFNREEAAARELGRALEREFDGVAYNEPWSGKVGLIFSAESHAERHGRCALELEIRQDLAEKPDYRARLVQVLARFFG